MRIKLKIIFLVSFWILALAVEQEIHAQNEIYVKSISAKIGDALDKLKLKLLLSDEQLKKIDTILVEAIPDTLSKSNRNQTLENINSMIESILTTRQKTKFDILKPTWLDELLGNPD